MFDASLYGSDPTRVQAVTREREILEDAERYRQMVRSAEFVPPLLCRALCVLARFLIRSGRDLLERYDPVRRLSPSRTPALGKDYVVTTY
jgi:hypothetical protein